MLAVHACEYTLRADQKTLEKKGYGEYWINKFSLP